MNIAQDQIQVMERDTGGRTYVITVAEKAIEVPSVTTIINYTVSKPALVEWAYSVGVRETFHLMNDDHEFSPLSPGEVKLKLAENGKTHKDEMEQAAGRGTAVHNVLEAIAKGEDFEYKVEYKPYVETLKKFLDDYQPTFHTSEMKVASLKHEYAGQFDGICTIGAHPPRRKHEDLTGQTVLLDLKTNKDGRVYAETHLPQVEAYKNAYLEMGGDPIDHAFVVGVGLDGKYQPCVSYASFNTFHAILNLYNELKRMKENNPNSRSK